MSASSSAAPAGDGAPGADAGSRTRIVDGALALMSAQGSAAVSMRQVAAAAGVNVATIYHYFPSKADLLRAVIEERRYPDRLAAERPAVPADASPAERLVALAAWLWAGALDEETVLRLVVGEALRGEAAATSSVRELVTALTAALEAWVAELLPEHAEVATDLAAVLRDGLFALVVEHLALGGVDVDEASRRAAALARLLPR